MGTNEKKGIKNGKKNDIYLHVISFQSLILLLINNLQNPRNYVYQPCFAWITKLILNKRNNRSTFMDSYIYVYKLKDMAIISSLSNSF